MPFFSSLATVLVARLAGFHAGTVLTVSGVATVTALVLSRIVGGRISRYVDELAVRIGRKRYHPVELDLIFNPGKSRR